MPNIQQINYSDFPKTEAKQSHQNGEKVLTEREKTLKSIEFLTQYMEDLKAGRPVENIHPDNDPYYLNPKVIADLIEYERDELAGVRGTVVRSVKDIIGEWDT